MSGCPGRPFRRRCGTLGTVVSGVLRGNAVVHGAWCWLLRRPGRGVDFRLGGLIIRYFVLHWGGALVPFTSASTSTPRVGRCLGWAGRAGSMVGSTVGHGKRGSGIAGRVGRAGRDFGSSGTAAERLGNLLGCWCFGVLLRWWLVGSIAGSE